MRLLQPRLAILWCLAIAILLAGRIDETVFAQEVDAEKAFQAMPRNAWYDKKNKQFIPPKVSHARDNPLRTKGWQAREKVTPQAAPAANWNWNLNLAGLSQALPTILFSLMAVVLVIMLVLLTYYALRNYMPVRQKRKSKNLGSVEVDLARAVDLPFEVQATQSNPFAEAERLMQLGRYDDAIVFLYGYQLLALDQARRIHLQKGKTNRMYLGELQSYLQLRRILETTMLTFEAFFFGKHSVTREQFMSCWAQCNDFHALLNMSEKHQLAPVITEAVTL